MMARGFGVVRMWASSCAANLAEALREIFDEAGYARFLRAEGTGNSREAYAKYVRETEKMRERRPRCC
jgi:pyridoxal biosynthesis lyase PdxS